MKLLTAVCSERASAARPFLSMEVMERAQTLERAGRSIVHMEVGEPDFDTPEVVRDAAVRAMGEGETHYTHSLGVPELRDAICARYAARYGVQVEPDRVMVTAGSSLGLLYLVGLLVEPGDEVVYATPHYACYPNFVRFFGGVPVEVPTGPADGYRVDPAAVRAAVTPRTRLILLNSPSNPTGAVLERDRLAALAELGPPVLCDEIYHGLEYEGQTTSVLEVAPEAMVADGFSKRYAMTGWRLGWLVVPRELVRPLQTMQQNFMISASSFSQAGGLAAIRHDGALVEPMRAVYERRRDVLVELLRDLGFGVPQAPGGAFYVFADASRFTTNSLQFAMDLLEGAGVGVGPGLDFGEAGARSVRFSYASSEACIREAARRMRGYLHGG